MDKRELFFPEVNFGGFSKIDGTVAFYTRVNSIIKPSFVILDVGCGRGRYSEDAVIYRRNLRIFKEKVKQVIGLDKDPLAKNNPYIDKFNLIDDNYWPIDDNSIDMIISDFVLEHIQDPDNFFHEANRVLKDNGYLCIRTTNLLSYVAIFSIIIPNKYHSKITSFVQNNRKDEDVFPTYYNCNAMNKIKIFMRKYSFESVVYSHAAEPSYMAFSRFFYFFGILFHKLLPNFAKPAIFAFGKVHKSY